MTMTTNDETVSGPFGPIEGPRPSAREAIQDMLDAGLLDDLMGRIDDGDLQPVEPTVRVPVRPQVDRPVQQRHENQEDRRQHHHHRGKHKHIFKTLFLCVNNSFHLLFHFLEISSSLFREGRVVINAYFREIFKLFLALEYFYIKLWSEINGEFSASKITSKVFGFGAPRIEPAGRIF